MAPDDVPAVMPGWIPLAMVGGWFLVFSAGWVLLEVRDRRASRRLGGWLAQTDRPRQVYVIPAIARGATAYVGSAFDAADRLEQHWRSGEFWLAFVDHRRPPVIEQYPDPYSAWLREVELIKLLRPIGNVQHNRAREDA